MAEPRDSNSAGTGAPSDASHNAKQQEVSQSDVEGLTGGEAKGKKSKKSKVTDSAAAAAAGGNNPAANMSDSMVESMLEMNPALKGELGGVDKTKAAEMLRKMDVSDLLTGLSLDSKNRKDMASFKFWQTQPVVRFDEQGKMIDGPIKQINPEQVSKEPDALIEGFEWATLDITNEKELQELHELLNGHFVEDQNAMFRLNYSLDFLNWALKSPGWRKEWNVGVRASKSGKLVASICGIPADVTIRGQHLKVTEINFLCIHKKLRSKRLAPVLIKEVTRRCYLSGIYQAVYTAGIVLPTPVSSCRYYHRALDWLKLYDVGFSPLPAGSTKARQITKNHLPSHTSTPGLRPMQAKDVDAVHDLLNRYLQRFDLAQSMSREEVDYFMVHREKPGVDQVVYTYVVEEPGTHKITDFASFYSLDSRVIQHDKHTDVRAAYLYYYASESAFAEKEHGLKERLQQIMNDILILAKKAKFDVFNALTSQDNPLFLESLKFGAGDGQLHYYMFNYRASPVPGGVNDKNLPDDRKRGGVGIVLF